MRWLLPLLAGLLLLGTAGCGPLQPATTPPSYGESRGSSGGA
jgi:hypothetical protein